jgi:hypothetical protein
MSSGMRDALDREAEIVIEARPDPNTLSSSLATLPDTVGRKHDQGKLRWGLLPWDALREIVRVLMKGAAKYAPGNWEHVPEARDRYFDALIRHVTAWYEGERNDPEWGLHHLAHACCCLLFLLALSLRGKIDGEKR